MNENLSALGEAIRGGKKYHLFDSFDGSYLSSHYFPRTAANEVRELQDHGRCVVVKYLTNHKVGAAKTA